MENHHAELHLLFTDSILCRTADELRGQTGRIYWAQWWGCNTKISSVRAAAYTQVEVLAAGLF